MLVLLLAFGNPPQNLCPNSESGKYFSRPPSRTRRVAQAPTCGFGHRPGARISICPLGHEPGEHGNRRKAHNPSTTNPFSTAETQLTHLTPPEKWVRLP